jgi:agmatinase
LPEPKREIPPYLKLQMEGPPYMGPTTFMKTVGLSEPSQLDDWQPDVAIVGAPWDGSSTIRAGARLGPRTIRTAQVAYPYWHLDLRVSPLDDLCVVDYGDAFCPPGMVEPAFAAIKERVSDVASRGIFPVILGGDHSITYPAAAAVAAARPTGTLGVIHFDAHADCVPEAYGNPLSHGTPMRRLIDSGAVPGPNFVQLGLRGFWPPQETFEWMAEQGMRSHRMSEFFEQGLDAVIDGAIEEALDGPEAIYISIDVDVLEPGLAPGNGAPEPGGMITSDLLRAVQKIVLATNVVALDIVEVNPLYDVGEVTSFVGSRLITEVLSSLAKKRQDQATGN